MRFYCAKAGFDENVGPVQSCTEQCRVCVEEEHKRPMDVQGEHRKALRKSLTSSELSEYECGIWHAMMAVSSLMPVRSVTTEAETSVEHYLGNWLAYIERCERLDVCPDLRDLPKISEAMRDAYRELVRIRKLQDSK